MSLDRRALLVGIGSAAVMSGAGCLGNGAPDVGDIDGTEDIDPGADYVVQGPEGLFLAKGPLNTDLDGVALHGFDLVEYFEAERALKGSERFEYSCNNATFRFANEPHLEMFADDPEAYMPSFGGYCALGVSNGYKDGMHRDAFEIFDDNLYFNLTPGLHLRWLSDPDARITAGAKNWHEIRDSTDPIHIGPGV